MARVLKAAAAAVAVAVAAESAVGLYSRLKTPVPKVRTFSTSQSSLQVAGPVWNLGRLNHVAIAVPDLEKAAAFYKNVLGAQVSETVPIPEHGVSVVFVNLGNTKMELLHPLGNDSPIAAFLQKNKAGGMHHICIENFVYLKIRKISFTTDSIIDPTSCATMTLHLGSKLVLV
ncbi:methylmalonyl-CoA epimerase, mitochondrial isoform X3 [Mirounga angustirostris]|uniref:methylmalonyl-CoA epimerase, mitochondrial isoform X3 n=1 Tax=Mirounga angustirostris TaxID=9716 RepID=UPI00313CE617